MADNTILMQHVSKAPASFTAGKESFESDETGIIVIPSELAGLAQAHGFSTDVEERPAPKPLKKDAKEADDKTKTAGGK